MTTVRVIPRLDIKGPNLVKGIHLEGLRVLGKPWDFAQYYYRQGADELLYIDVVASLYNRNSLQEIISKTAKEIFIPLTVGGGLRSINDIKEVLRAGADKVSLNTAAIKNPQLVQEAANLFGSSTVAVSIEAIREPNGEYFAYTDNGREYTGKEVISWAQQVEKLGAGEILLTSIDKEGTGEGYDVTLVKLISDAVSIPVIASGGAGDLKHITDVVLKGSSSAVAIASMLHYGYIAGHQAKHGEFDNEGNIEFLKQNKTFSTIKTATLEDIKKAMVQADIPCRFTINS